MIEFLLAILCTVVIFCINFLNSTNRRRHELANRIPGPKTIPIFGNSLSFMNRRAEETMKLIADYHSEFGDLFRVKAFNIIAFMTIDPNIIEIILRSNTKYLAKNRMYGMLKPWLGDGLLLSTGKKWFQRRKILTPAFHFSILEQFVEVFDEQSRILVDRLQDHCNEKVFNIHPFITLMALDVVCETAMGVKINAQTNTNNEYVRAVSTIANIIANRFTKFWQRSDILMTLFASDQKKKYNQSIKILHEFTESVINRRRYELMQNDKNTDDSIHSNGSTEIIDESVGIRSKMALLDVLLKSTVNEKPLTNAEIREEVDTFMFEGHDTTTAGIVFTLYLLSRHKSVQDELYKEIHEVVGGDRNAPITYRQLQSLKYMEAVIKESFRLFPPVPIIGRRLDEDVELDDGRILPADTNFNLMLFVMFRSEKYFEEPEKFDPNRFIDGDGNEKYNPYMFIPFSAGSRNCIGQKFALLEMKSTISKLLRYYELLPMGDAPITSSELVLRSKNGIQMGLKPRIPSAP